MTDTATTAPAQLRASLAALRLETPHVRARDAAEKLGISEAQLVALDNGTTATKLRPAWKEIFEQLPTLGRVMALTRNDAVVSEITGTYNAPEIEGMMGQVAGEPIDLRLFLRGWATGFAVRSEARGQTVRSLQFFNARGEAVHKVFLKNDEGVAAFDALVAQFADGDTADALSVSGAVADKPEKPDAEVDVEGFRAAWAAMTNTHEFFGLMGKFGVSRTQALRLAGGEWAEPVAAQSLQPLLEGAAASEVPIMVFVGSEGVLQIRSGVVKNVKVIDGWTNVLDKDFNLHVLDRLVASAWRVRKPSHGGIVTSLELFDAKGRNVMLVFGKRAEGGFDTDAWRGVVSSLPGLTQA